MILGYRVCHLFDNGQNTLASCEHRTPHTRHLTYDLLAKRFEQAPLNLIPPHKANHEKSDGLRTAVLIRMPLNAPDLG